MESTPEKKSFDIDEIKAKLGAKIIGKAIHGYDIVDSTNAIARTLAREGAEEGTVVLAEIQRAGIGRLNREWFSPKGGLWLSIILKPDIKPSEATKVILMAGVAVARTLATVYGLDAKIKWPNDVLVNGKKVCGILTEIRTLESKIDYLVLGIGINANFELEELPEGIRIFTTTLRHETGRDLPLGELFLSLLREIDECYDILRSGNPERILKAWKELSDTLGRKVKITTQKESMVGIALDLDDTGALILKTSDDTIQKFVAGDCVHVSKTT
ncbi:MAG: biotin--[acetyl-CoA-carboxylase] ligase [Thermoplasmata archaeon]